jgi:hypothetical protein
VTLGDVIAAPSGELNLSPSVTDRGNSILQASFAGGGKVHQLTDPAVGDKILAATAFGPARGLLRRQNFAELSTLPSSHGLAILPLSDDIQLKLQELELIILRPEGLSLSNGSVVSLSLSRGETESVTSQGSVNYQKLRAHTPVEFREGEIALKNWISEAEEAKLNEARLDLARYYIANDFAAEALGLLNVVARSDPSRNRDAEMQMLKAAAEIRIGRYQSAIGRLEKSEFERSGDASFWKALGYAKLRDWTKAMENTRRAIPVLSSYSPMLVHQFYFAATRAALGINDQNSAKDYLSSLQVEGMTANELAEFDTLLGYLSDSMGRKTDAIAAFDRAISSGIRPAMAEANNGLMTLYHRDGDLKAKEIIPQLEQMVTVWRGDEIELANRKLLAQLYVEDGQYRSAFDSMKSAVTGAPAAETTRQIQDDMNKVFVSLYLDGIADTMPPVEALSLFYDFRELTPVGRQGDEIVRRLADRLISVDLLDQASAMLAHQVDHRLKGVARAQIAADLAIIYLMNEEADKALALLRRTRLAGLPKQLERQRLIVEARALAGTGKTELGAALLSGINTPDARQTTAEIYWNAERWQQAAEQFELKHQDRWSDPLPLADEERIEILKAAIGYSLSSDDLGLARLRTKYASKMTRSVDASAFDTVTRPVASAGIEFRAVIRQVAAIDTMEQFLENYREKYMSQPVLDSEPI